MSIMNLNIMLMIARAVTVLCASINWPISWAINLTVSI